MDVVRDQEADVAVTVLVVAPVEEGAAVSTAVLGGLSTAASPDRDAYEGAKGEEHHRNARSRVATAQPA